MTWLVAWRFLRPLLPYIASALVVLGLLAAYGHRQYQRGSHSRDAEVAAKQGTIDNLTAASAKALTINEANVARINGLQTQITKDKNDEAAQRLVDGSSAIDAYILSHRAPKVSSGVAGQNHAPGLPDAPGEPNAAPDQAVVSRDDLNACNAAYVTATGLQDWIRAQASIDRNTP